MHTAIPSAWPRLPEVLFPLFLLAWQILGQSDLSQVLKATLVGLRVTPGQF